MKQPTITKCPPGYAYGYVPVNGATDMQDLYNDTLHQTQAAHVSNLMHSMKKDKGDKLFNKLQRTERNQARNNFAKNNC